MKVTEKALQARRRNGLLGGRPLGTIEDTVMYRRMFLQTLAEMINKERVPLIRAMLKEAKDGNVEAFKALLDRSQGKPAQSVEIGGKDGNPIVFMPLELIQKHSLEVEVIESNTTQIDNNVNTKIPKNG